MEMLSYRAGCLLTEVMWSHYGLQLEKNMSSKMVFSCEHMAKALAQTARICLYCKWRILKESLAIWATSVLMKLFMHFRDYVCDICVNGRLRRVSRIWMQGCADDGSFKAQFCSCQLPSAAWREIYSQAINFTCVPINITCLAIKSENVVHPDIIGKEK